MDLFDAYAEQHGDPVLTLFEIQGNKDLEPSLRLRAAADLLPYRYPRMKSVEVEMVAPPAEVVVLTEAEIAEFEKEFREEFPL